MTNHTPTPTLLPKKHHTLITEMIHQWQEKQVIDDEVATQLKASISLLPFDWQKMARYAFIIAIVCLVISIGAVLADAFLIRLLMQIFNATATMKCLFFCMVSVGIFYYGLFLRKRYPHRLYSNEAVFFLGVLALATAITFLGIAMDTGTGHYAILFGLAAILYALLGLWFPSKLVWVFGLLAFGAWMGTETGYASGYGAYFLGMNYPLRFVFLGCFLVLSGLFSNKIPIGESDTFWSRFGSMSEQTKVIGLLNLFIALWILSIFGNHGEITAWYQVRQYELFHWSLLFGLVAIAAIWYGLKHDDGVFRGFGLTFLGINLYTRFFEYFWDTSHKAIFFSVLALSFWYLGRKSETIWHLGGLSETSIKKNT